MRQVRYADLPAEYAEISDAVLKTVDRVMRRGRFILGEELIEFEKRIAEITGSAYAVGVGSGYDALFLALESLHLNTKDEVIIPGYTFVATAAAVTAAGGTPVFADCGEDLNIDPQELFRLVSERTRAVIAVHLHGRPCDLSAMLPFCRKRNIVLIEDAAQAFGSTLNGQWLGTFATLGCFSLHPLKSLSVPGDGGFILSNEFNTAEWLRCRRDHGRKNGQYVMPGVNSRLDNLKAAVAGVKLDRFNDWAEARRRAARLYHQELEDAQNVRVLDEPKNSSVVWSCYPIICPDGETLRAGLAAAGIEALTGFNPPVQRLDMYASKNAVLPKTDELAPRVVLLPMHPFLAADDIRYVARTVKDLTR
jgi:dTDP-4-amino-4,6-dideoxygalactose transaminase